MKSSAIKCLKQAPQSPRHLHIRQYSTTSPPKLDIAQLLSKPTWSVSSLLPKGVQSTPSVTSKQLHHLLRLSALPPPKDAAEETKMLATLSLQLHFVRDIQQVDTSGVEALKSLQDDTELGRKQVELGMEKMAEALGKEEVRGRLHKRIRRKREADGERKEKEWDVLGLAEKRVGRYFVVEGGKREAKG